MSWFQKASCPQAPEEVMRKTLGSFCLGACGWSGGGGRSCCRRDIASFTPQGSPTCVHTLSPGLRVKLSLRKALPFFRGCATLGDGGGRATSQRLGCERLDWRCERLDRRCRRLGCEGLDRRCGRLGCEGLDWRCRLIPELPGLNCPHCCRTAGSCRLEHLPSRVAEIPTQCSFIKGCLLY